MNIDRVEHLLDQGDVVFEVRFHPHSVLDRANLDQFEVLMEALKIYDERNRKYKDNWRRQGWRSPLFDLRRKVERVWDVFWNATPIPEVCGPGTEFEIPPYDLDDALDVINFGALSIRAIREGDRDGSWGY